MAGSADPVSAVQQYIDGLNRADVNAMAVRCADPMSILVRDPSFPSVERACL